jgi:hypothetical protein
MPNSYDYPIPLDPNTLQPMPMGGTMGMSQQPNFRWQSQAGNQFRSFMNNPDLAMALLANSGPSPYKRGFGEVLGTSMLQANQMKSQREDDAFKRQYMQAQMAAMQNRQGASPYGQYQPGDYTPKSWAEFLKSSDPSVLERYTAPRQEYKPSFRNVQRTLPDGSTQLGSFDTQTNEYSWNGPIVPPGTKARVDAEGKALGEASGGQSTKMPAKASMDYVIGEFRKNLITTPQGGLFGYKGKSGTVIAKADKERFENLREQLSTELRTVFRIPGEGTLSDREQAQYGIQLPSTDYEPANNVKILDDLEQRTALRLQTPVDGQQQPFSIVGPKKETAAERAKRLGL